jgi:hypothetical protein
VDAVKSKSWLSGIIKMSTDFNREDAWSELFRKFPILNEVDAKGYHDIKADDIRRYKEPRLMCKVDYREGLPKVMSDSGLSILAINNGTYRIARNSPFIDIDEELTDAAINEIAPPDLITLDHQNPTSESAALDIASTTGILEAVFGESFSLTIRGRKRCDLDFKIGSVDYPVRGVQVEVDGGYESNSGIHLIEAKIGSASNINVRQLLYPHRYWENFSKKRKEVSSYVFFYQEGVYRFIPFHTEGERFYVDQGAERLFRIREKLPNLDIRLIKTRSGVVNNAVPFPQADNLDKVIAVVIQVAGAEATLKEDVLLMFDMVSRQIDYYCNAALWLGLIEYDTKNQSYQATEAGLVFARLSYANQLARVAEIALTNEVFNFVLHNPTTLVPDLIREKNGLTTQSTYERRLLTVASWLSHIDKVLSNKSKI